MGSEYSGEGKIGLVGTLRKKRDIGIMAVGK